MDFTGERVVPGQVDADLWQEHVSRYEFALAFVAPGSRVLDAGCGAGYGAARLAAHLAEGGAGEVVGVDVAAEAIRWAAEHYPAPKLRFRTGDICALPDADASFDLVVAFEVIEHLAKASTFLQEVRRVLRPSGKLLVSTPNRLYYTDERGYQNPFHTCEYDVAGFRALLEAHFMHCTILEQNHAPAITFREDNSSIAEVAAPAAGANDQPYFFIAVCSQQEVAVKGLVYLPESGNVLRERERHIHKLEADLAAFQEETRRELAERREWAEKLEAELREKGDVIAGLQRELEERREWVTKIEADLQAQLAERLEWTKTLHAEILAKDAFIVRMQREAAERAAWALDLDRRVVEAQTALEKQDAELAARAKWAESLNEEIAAARARLQELDAEMMRRENARMAQVTELEQELGRRAVWANSLNNEITALQVELRLVQESKAYRAAKFLGLAPKASGSEE